MRGRELQNLLRYLNILLFMLFNDPLESPPLKKMSLLCRVGGNSKVFYGILKQTFLLNRIPFITALLGILAPKKNQVQKWKLSLNNTPSKTAPFSTSVFLNCKCYLLLNENSIIPKKYTVNHTIIPLLILPSKIIM